MLRLTPVTKNLLLINVGVFILQTFFTETVFSPAHGRDVQIDKVAMMFSLYNTGSPDFQPYQFLTHMFLHGNFSHILHNMLILFFFGPLLEQTLGDKRFLLLYMVCGLGAAVSQVGYNYFFLNEPMMLLGASGAVMGVLIATAIFYPNLQVYIYFLFPVKIKYLALVFLALDLFQGVSNANTGVAHFAHLGGAVFAVVLLLYWKRTQNS